jgi:glycosyltransferase involved in cell wall biosynthesis
MLDETRSIDLSCLDTRYSTTRLVAATPAATPVDPDSKFQPLLQLPGNGERRGEGGLRAKGFFKRSLSDKPLITVVTVVFNGAATLEDTIQSVIGQTYDNIEYIVIDGGSTDGTIEILKQYEHAIDYWVSEKDKGLYDAMNKGIALASGSYVGTLNADDLFIGADVLHDVVEKIRASNVDAVFSCVDIVDPNDMGKILRRYRVSHFTPWYLRTGIMPAHPTFYCRRTVYEKLGLYRTDYRVAADFEMMVRMRIKGNISWAFLDKVTVKMRSGGVSSSGLAGQIQHNFENVRACRTNGFYTNIFLVALKIPFKLLEKIAR